MKKLRLCASSVGLNPSHETYCVPWPSRKEHQVEALVFLISRLWVQVPVVTLVFKQET